MHENVKTYFLGKIFQSVIDWWKFLPKMLSVEHMNQAIWLPVDVSKKSDGLNADSIDPDQKWQCAATFLGLCCLIRPVCRVNTVFDSYFPCFR